MGRRDIHKVMLDYQMGVAWEILDRACLYDYVNEGLMADSFLQKACDLELLALGFPPAYYPHHGTTFDSYFNSGVKWLTTLYPSARKALPPPTEKPIASVKESRATPYVANTLAKPKRSDYIVFGAL